jgi:hypothetical protein
MKVGRNEPCPCGSGRKYKHCCGASEGRVIEAADRFRPDAAPGPEAGFSFGPDGRAETFMEGLGAPNAATALLKRIKAAAAEREFASADELEEFVRSLVESERRRPIADFAGLAPEDLAAMEDDPAGAVAGLLDFPGPLDAADAAATPVLRQALWLLRRLAVADGAELTASGALKPALVREWYDATVALADAPADRARSRPSREAACWDLARVRQALRRRRLVRTVGGRLTATKRGAALAAGPDYRDLYAELFVGWIGLYADDAAPTNQARPEFAGRFALFGLRLACRLPDGSTRDDYGAALAEAFPDVFPEGEYAYYDRALAAADMTLIPAEALGLLAETPVVPGFAGGGLPRRRGAAFARLAAWKK